MPDNKDNLNESFKRDFLEKKKVSYDENPNSIRNL